MRLSTFGNTQQVNTQPVSKQQGFTLIELVVVIVILGILAVTAAPKFIDLTSDAKGSVVQAVKASINSAADMAHAKALIEGKVKIAGTTQKVTIAGTEISLNYGWPVNASMAALLELDGDITVTTPTAGATFTHKDAATAADCRALYNSTAVTNAETRPTINSVVTGC
jgi:MSHA pilin protein MshA